MLHFESTKLLQRARIRVEQKWSSNEDQPNELRVFPLDLNAEEITIKLLGMFRNFSMDTFTHELNISANHNFTKRDVLSQIESISPSLVTLNECFL